MNTSVLRAVFRRNFVSYFANPTGYLFICVFVLLSSIAAFWPDEFFNANLANLDQLNNNPFLNFFTIMLVFVPAITMGVWADERRQGTDELLLTIPAGDFDIVLGKYLAAVAIYTVSLLFSLLCNYAVLKLLLGDPDGGLFLATYAGYWLVGLAMLAIGMVASFLTSNLTIAFVLGMLFNAPLVLTGVLASLAEFVTQFLLGKFWAAALAFSPEAAAMLKQWSLHSQFQDFSRGVLNLSGAAYFLMIVAVMLYLSMILIGRRHWRGGWQRRSMIFHYTVRTLALAVAAVGLSLILQRHDARWDATSERVSSLSPQSVKLLKGLKLDRPVRIEAFVSPEVPEDYVQTRLNLLSALREIQTRRGDKIHVQINTTEPLTDEADLAERRYGITPHQIATRVHGARRNDNIFLGVAMKSDPRSIAVPFIDKGIPAEYEVVRSLCTVVQPKRRRVGVLNTEAPLFGGMSFQGFTPGWPIIEELQKQYEVVRADPAKLATERYDVLLAVQPSTLSPENMGIFLAAVRTGQPTVIFEDPFPALEELTPTSMPRQPSMMQPTPYPKGDIGGLWNLLGVSFPADQVVWQEYDPYPVASFPKEFVFVNRGEGVNPFDPDDPISAGLQQVLFLCPGSITKSNTSDLDFAPLMRTRKESGEVSCAEMMRGGRGQESGWAITNTEYVLAAHIRGKPAANPWMAGEKGPAGDAPAAAKPGKPEMNVVLVSDVDLLSPAIFQLREQSEIPQLGIRIDLDNVAFVLNAVDVLAGDEHDFYAVRSHRPKYRTLTRIEERTASSTQAAAKERKKFLDDFNKKVDEETAAIQKQIADLRNQNDGNATEALNDVSIAARAGQDRVDAAKKRYSKDLDRKVNTIMKNLNSDVRQVQNRAKWLAVLLPPIPPLALGLLVFAVRRTREREGVSRKRLR